MKIYTRTHQINKQINKQAYVRGFLHCWFFFHSSPFAFDLFIYLVLFFAVVVIPFCQFSTAVRDSINRNVQTNTENMQMCGERMVGILLRQKKEEDGRTSERVSV